MHKSARKDIEYNSLFSVTNVSFLQLYQVQILLLLEQWSLLRLEKNLKNKHTNYITSCPRIRDILSTHFKKFKIGTTECISPKHYPVSCTPYWIA